MDETRIPYLQNMLDGFDIKLCLDRKELATIEIIFNENNIKLVFFYCVDRDNHDSDLFFYDMDTLTTSFNENKDIPVLVICSIDSHHENQVYLACEHSGVRPNDFIGIIKNIQSKIFIAAPITQVFRFLDRDNRKLLFKGGESMNE